VSDRAYWPNGTDASGVETIATSLMCGLLGAASVYLGCQKTREIVRRVAADDSFWEQVDAQSTVMQGHLREVDAAMKTDEEGLGN